MGLDDLAREGRYVFAESHQEAEYFNWAAGQPNNNDQYDCVWKAVSKEAIRGWHDATCSLTEWAYCGEIHALCEFDLDWKTD